MIALLGIRGSSTKTFGKRKWVSRSEMTLSELSEGCVQNLGPRQNVPEPGLGLQGGNFVQSKGYKWIKIKDSFTSCIQSR